MPIYEYQCEDCSCRFELRKSFNDKSAVTCPQCGGNARRVFSPVPIIFKGSGFYSTDNRGNHGHSAPASDTDEAKTSSTSEAKTGSTSKAKTSSTDTGS